MSLLIENEIGVEQKIERLEIIIENILESAEIAKKTLINELNIFKTKHKK